jgi:hypothetical protein
MRGAIGSTDEAFAKPTHDPYTELGDCIFMDYRTLHGGLANKSDGIRPILYVTYHRPWFRDYQNYSRQHSLILSDEEYAKILDPDRRLFDWAMKRK